MAKKQEIKEITFAPGCFDGFEGTQEELDQFIAEIKRMAESGELFERSVPIDELSDEEMVDLNDFLESTNNITSVRKLH